MGKQISVEFRVDRATKNTVRFAEVDGEAMNTIYVPKDTLSKIEWTEGSNIIVTLQPKAEQ